MESPCAPAPQRRDCRTSARVRPERRQRQMPTAKSQATSRYEFRVGPLGWPCQSPLELTAAAALFDMDGTLVDSTAVVEALWRDFCREHGVDAAGARAVVARAAYAGHRAALPAGRARRRGDRDRAPSWRPGAGDDDRHRRDPRGRARCWRASTLPWAVVTSAPRELAVRRMVAAGLPLPEVLVPADEIEHGKPHPDGYLRGRRAAGREAGRLRGVRGRRARRPVGARVRRTRGRRRRSGLARAPPASTASPT